MGRIVRLTERDLTRIVKRVLNESGKDANPPKVGDSISMFDDAEDFTTGQLTFSGTVCNVINNGQILFSAVPYKQLIIKQDIAPYKCIDYMYDSGSVKSKDKGWKSKYSITEDSENFRYVDCNTYCKK
jgi:hypothetical protein